MSNRVKWARQVDLEEVKTDIKNIKCNDLKHLSRNVYYLMGAVAVILVIVGAILGAVLLM